MTNNDSEHKVNIKARIDRHSRMLKDNITLKNRVLGILKKNNLTYKLILALVLISMPIYPMFAGIVHNNNEYEFYRGYIDEDSILGSYYTQEEPEEYLEEVYESDDGFISDIAILNEDRNYDGSNEVRTYTVKSGDSISVIASKFGVTRDTVYEFNGLSKRSTIKPGQILNIPATSGIPYKVKSGDSILAIANKYEINSEKIKEFNKLDSNTLKIGQEIFLPGAKKIIVKQPVYKKTYTKTTTKTKTNYIASEYTNSKGVYKLKWRKPYSGAPGNCTHYVASYKNVNWRGNANQWMRNAAAKGHKVQYGRHPSYAKLGSIVVLEGRGYNLRYGHVAIVMEIKKDYMIVSDMNYRKLYEVTYRKVPLSSRNITGYIYVN